MSPRRPLGASTKRIKLGNKAAGRGDTRRPGSPVRPSSSGPLPAGPRAPGPAPQGSSRVLRRLIASDLGSYCTWQI